MAREERLSIKKQVYNSVLNDLLEGKFAGKEFLRESEIMEIYGFGRSSVREALIELCSNNILRSIPRFGYKIVKFSVDDVRQVLMFRKILEKESLIYTYNNVSHKVFQELKEYVLNNATEEEGTLLEHWIKNVNFHLKLCSYAGNKYMYQQLEDALYVLIRAYTQFHYDAWKNYDFEFSDDLHLKVVESLLADDIDAAVGFLIEDVGLFETKLKLY